MTLEQLYNLLGDQDQEINAAYDAARARKVAEIADSIRDDLRSPGIAEDLAERLMSSAEEMGRISGDVVSAELPSRFTVRGNPIPILV